MSNQFGRSMIEMLGVLAIIGVLSIGGIAGYSHAMKKNKINTLKQSISHVVMQVKNYYINHDSYEGLTTDTAIEAGIIPDDMLVADETTESGKAVKTIYGGNFIIRATSDPSDGTPLFAVILTDVPKDIVLELSTTDWSSGEGLIQMDLVNGDEQEQLIN